MNISIADKGHLAATTKIVADLVIDVGLYTGEDTAYYLHRGYRVVAIDANPVMVERAKTRFAAEIAAERLILLNVGIFTSAGQFDFWVSSHEDWSSFEKGNALKLNARAHAISVPCVAFSAVLEQYGVPFYLKIDIEKLDGACLAALTPQLRPEYVSWEASVGSLPELETMHALGYNAFKCIDQMTLKGLSPKMLARPRTFRTVRRAIDRFDRRTIGTWTFQKGLSSGPFGEETHGQWYSFDDFAQSFVAFCKANPSDEQWPTWFDFHAARKIM